MGRRYRSNLDAPSFSANTTLVDKYWKHIVGVLNIWRDNRSIYKHGWYYDVEVAMGDNAGLKYTIHEDGLSNSQGGN